MTTEPLAHAEATFSFVVEAPVEVVAPLFGADRERVWAEGWNPKFVHPVPAADREGMVFTVERDGATSVWVNTRFDLDDGVVQYVHVLPGTMATRLTVKAVAEGRCTQVSVNYERTALRVEANDLVRRMSDDDRCSGPEWKGEIDAYLRVR